MNETSLDGREGGRERVKDRKTERKREVSESEKEVRERSARYHGTESRGAKEKEGTREKPKGST